ncbi:hypothetical protein GCM10007390_30530 [Persicitalea jodogahamensis]|uniref:Uncharacterized protein n=1 Tax=Persicitalea jodogahamensis TaxID=402147 RepID=A0A8J3DAF6_9BACT|nr:hypothetical protein GCM10007390_30530 [Persicitalea jodogahamensis]
MLKKGNLWATLTFRRFLTKNAVTVSFLFRRKKDRNAADAFFSPDPFRLKAIAPIGHPKYEDMNCPKARMIYFPSQTTR